MSTRKLLRSAVCQQRACWRCETALSLTLFMKVPKRPRTLLHWEVISRNRGPVGTWPSISKHADRRAFTVSVPAQTNPKSTTGQSIGYSQLPTLTTCILAHIDHGKSTLADRLLELTGTIPKVNAADPKGVNRQVLDTLQVERQRGITVKSQAVSMIYEAQSGKEKGNKWLLNLIDTPGHVDFSYEVSRSLSACQSALLLVDATQGVQAQTISVFRVASAQKPKLSIIPVINKIDLPNSDIDKCIAQMRSMLGLEVQRPGTSEDSGIEPILISAKTGQGVEQVLEALVASAQSRPTLPTVRSSQHLQALVFDSWYDQFKGVVALVAVREGTLLKGERIASKMTGKLYEVLSLGINHPGPTETPSLRSGQVGWLICNMRNISDAKIGDIFQHPGEPKRSRPQDEEMSAALHDASLKALTPMVYAGLYPSDSTEFGKLEESIQKLALNDRSVTVTRESSAALGQGCRIGFLGTLHLDVFRQRLQDEFKHEVLVTAPTVTYRVRYAPDRAPQDVLRQNQLSEDGGGVYKFCSNPLEFPEEHERKTIIEAVEEPLVKGRLRCPQDCVGDMMALCAEHRGVQLEYDFEQVGVEASSYAGGGDQISVELVYRLPLSEIVTDFYDKLKSRSSGFATFEYEHDGYEPSDLVRVSFLVSGTPVDPLSTICHRSKAQQVGKAWAGKLKEAIPRQLHEVAIQAMANGKVIARETIKAYRKDVTGYLYGGDVTRKMKLLAKQKKGKKKTAARAFGNVHIPQEAFAQVLDRR
ncbi:GTP-binding protein lepa [Tilletiaria anomala UBC 951]|uniref:GTP-binding protein lepa n=1 Tax=Tilletiaria anomala (strain ATCC 24038 / CBS 436.72 / UBC 951) TaxID=1037660 RepID=A0A066VP92_TILAU|nr:GTP-binding protein lepa [Tilletiaria anomala UBC 951]KDN43567.1 GTP-binding protein lepa [Tilletiaria anomala UBC 951]